MNERQHTLVRMIDKDYQTDNLSFTNTDRDGTCCISVNLWSPITNCYKFCQNILKKSASTLCNMQVYIILK